MRKIILFFAIVVALCSCEKFEEIGGIFKSKHCTIENSMPIETIVDKEVLEEAISYSTKIIVYETTANIEDEKYGIRNTSYSLEYGDTQKIVLDNRTKYIKVIFYTTIKTINSKTEVCKGSDFIRVEKNMYLILDKDFFEKDIDKE